MKHLSSTTVSAKGQVVLPKSMRDELGWGPGVRLSVRVTPDGVLLSPVRPFEQTSMEGVFGCLSYEGPAKSVEDMDAAVLDEARRRG